MGEGGLRVAWWLFVIVGLALMAVEIFTPGFIALWFGIAALITAIPVYLGASLTEVILVYALSVLLLTIFGRKIVLRLSSARGKAVETNVHALIGREGVVVEAVDPIRGTGLVRVGGEVWTAVSDDQAAIEKDESIVVQSVEGVKLKVRVAKKEG